MYRAMKKNIASIAKLTMNATMLAPRNVRERKKLKSTIGEGRRRSIDREGGQRERRDREQRRARAPEPQCHALPSHQRQHQRRQARS